MHAPEATTIINVLARLWTARGANIPRCVHVHSAGWASRAFFGAALLLPPNISTSVARTTDLESAGVAGATKASHLAKGQSRLR